MISPLLYLALIPIGVSVFIIACWRLDRSYGCERETRGDG